MKTAVLGANSGLPSLVDRGGKLVWSTDEKASLFSVYIGANQCIDSFHQPHSCDSSPIPCSVAF